MTEIKIIAGKHKCGKVFDMRITDVKDDDKNIMAWVIYGVCKKCNVIVMQSLFVQSEEPTIAVDYIIDYDKITKDKKYKKGKL